MANPVGFRFRPTDEEIIDIYLRPKHLQSNTSHVDEVISTVDICSFDPWNLPSQSRMETNDEVWYFFGRKENKYGRGDRQIRQTKSGFWKKTGVTMDIMRKRGNRQKIGEKRVLVFKFHGGSKSHWVMHEYHATFSSPIQMMMAYTLCKVKFMGERRELSVASGSGIEHTHSLIPHTNYLAGLSVETEVSSFHIQEPQNPSQFTGFLDVDALDWAFHNICSDVFKDLLDDDEQSKTVSMQDDCNNHRPQKPLTSVFIDHSTDDSDSDPISAITISIPTSSTCDSFGSSNHLVDQIETQQQPS